MTIHPLSICNQLTLKFEGVARARFEFDGPATVYRVELADGGSARERADISEFVHERRPMGSYPPRIEPWQDGPEYPDLYNEFSRDELRLLEASDTTHDGIIAGVVQALPFAADAACETIGPGAVRITLSSPQQLTGEHLERCRRFAIALFADTRVNVEVRQGDVQPEANSDKDLPILVHQGSRSGIVDPVLLRLVQEDEDVYRQARVSNFGPGKSPRNGFSVLLPPDPRGWNLRHLLPLYDFAYVPLSGILNGPAYGVDWKEILQLVGTGRLVPVATRRLGEYDQSKVRELHERGTLLLPRTLTAATASSLLDTNPLWRLGMEDRALALAVVRDTRSILSGVINDDRLAQLVATWLDFQVFGLTDFEAGTLRQGGLVPMHFGPGALAAKVFQSFRGKHAPDLEVQFVGLHVSQALALGSVCAPSTDQSMYPFYELTTAMLGARQPDQASAPLEQLPIVAELDRILESIAFTTSTDTPITEWIQSIEPFAEQLRSALNGAFEASDTASRETVSKRAAELEWQLANFVANRKSLASAVDKFEVLGVASDAIAWCADSSFPFSGTLVGALLRRLLPGAWDALSANQHTLAARDVLEGIGGRVSPATVRLHRVTEEASRQKS